MAHTDSLVNAATVIADMWGWHNGDAGSGWWILMIVGMVAFWALVIYAVVWLARGGIVASRGPGADRPTALDILDRRLAEGDVTPEEYERRRALLESRGNAQGQSPA